MKNRIGNCQHGLSLDVRSEDCCLICASPKCGEDDFFKELAKNQKDLEPEFIKIVDRHFWELLA